MDYTTQIQALKDANDQVVAITAGLTATVAAHQSLTRALGEAQANLKAAQAALITPAPTEGAAATAATA